MHYSNAKPKIMQGTFSHEPECSAEVLSTGDHSMAKHTQEEGSGTEREAEQEKYPTRGWRTVSLHLSCHMCQNLVTSACSVLVSSFTVTAHCLLWHYSLIQSKHLNAISSSCSALPKGHYHEAFGLLLFESG